MNKSKILKVLGDYVNSYRVERDGGIDFLIVQVDCIHNYHLKELSKYIMNIKPVYFKHLMDVTFANIEID